jgi:integrase
VRTAQEIALLVRNRSFTRFLKRTCLSADSRFHDLRHTCATLLFSRSVHPKYVQELLGYSNIAITLDTYSHVITGMGDQTARAMELALETVQSKEKDVGS